MMNIEDVEIGSKYEDTLGKAKYSKIGTLLKDKLKRIVIITNKSSNSIEYKDEADYISWISFEDFVRLERSVNRVRFIVNVV